MTKWLNTKHPIHKANSKLIVKPCHELGFCPYGQLVEAFNLKERRNAISCKVFGHDCPVYYHAEFFCEDEEEDKLGLKVKE